MGGDGVGFADEDPADGSPSGPIACDRADVGHSPAAVKASPHTRSVKVFPGMNATMIPVGSPREDPGWRTVPGALVLDSPSSANPPRSLQSEPSWCGDRPSFAGRSLPTRPQGDRQRTPVGSPDGHTVRLETSGPPVRNRIVSRVSLVEADGFWKETTRNGMKSARRGTGITRSLNPSDGSNPLARRRFSAGRVVHTRTEAACGGRVRRACLVDRPSRSRVYRIGVQSNQVTKRRRPP